MLKELLKLPFRVKIFQNNKVYVADINDIPVCMLLPTNTITYEIYDKLKYFIRDALNEKYERDYSELRWEAIFDDGFLTYCKCPKCHWDESKISNEEISIDGVFNFCPNCGQRLLPPEGE